MSATALQTSFINSIEQSLNRYSTSRSTNIPFTKLYSIIQQAYFKLEKQFGEDALNHFGMQAEFKEVERAPSRGNALTIEAKLVIRCLLHDEINKCWNTVDYTFPKLMHVTISRKLSPETLTDMLEDGSCMLLEIYEDMYA